MHVAPAQRRGALWPAIALGACLAGVHAEARAQDAPRERLRPAGRSASAAAAWVALTLTPDGALAPEAPPRAALDERVHVRVATLSRDAVLSQRAFGVTFDLPAGGSVLSLTGGWVQSRCERLEGAESSDVSTRCRGGAMAGARFGHVVVSRSWGAAKSSSGPNGKMPLGLMCRMPP